MEQFFGYQELLVCAVSFIGDHCGLFSPQHHLAPYEASLKSILVVSLGGIIGSLARWGVSLALPNTTFPWAVLLVNYLGSIILAFLLIYIKQHKSPRWWWRPALGSGFCGGFTTYSAFAVKIDQDFRAGQINSAITYALASLVGTYILVFAVNEFFGKKSVEQ